MTYNYGKQKKMSDEINEETLFLRLKEVLIPDLERAVDEFSSFDCTSKILNAHIELKCRHTHYSTLLIEKSKYDRLMEIASTNLMAPLYINSTPEGVWAFNLLKFDNITWTEQDNLPATTEFDNKDKVTKAVGFLPIEDGDRLFWN
jgi:hypothetical protein